MQMWGTLLAIAGGQQQPFMAMRNSRRSESLHRRIFNLTGGIIYWRVNATVKSILHIIYMLCQIIQTNLHCKFTGWNQGDGNNRKLLSLVMEYWLQWWTALINQSDADWMWKRRQLLKQPEWNRVFKSNKAKTLKVRLVQTNSCHKPLKRPKLSKINTMINSDL